LETRPTIILAIADYGTITMPIITQVVVVGSSAPILTALIITTRITLEGFLEI